MRVTIGADHFVRKRHRNLAAAAVNHIGAEEIHAAVIGLFPHDHPKAEFVILLFVVIGHYRPKARPNGCQFRIKRTSHTEHRLMRKGLLVRDERGLGILLIARADFGIAVNAK
jgi:hypothetical protein